jgi:hypothetical protein
MSGRRSRRCVESMWAQGGALGTMLTKVSSAGRADRLASEAGR